MLQGCALLGDESLTPTFLNEHLLSIGRSFILLETQENCLKVRLDFELAMSWRMRLFSIGKLYCVLSYSP